MGGELVFLKICGSALDSDASRATIAVGLLRLARARPDDLFYVICGGGAPVDALRLAYDTDPNQLCVDWMERGGREAGPDEAAHWLAITIMDQRADVLRASCPSVGNLIFPPVARLLVERESTLPRSWEVTSDSITYWLAVSLACDPSFPRIFLLKDVDGVLKTGMPARQIARRSLAVQGRLVRQVRVHEGHPKPALPSFPFDEYMFGLVDEFQQPFYVVHWQHVDRVIAVLDDDGKVPFTVVSPVP